MPTYKLGTCLTLHTSFDYPSIPIRGYDWSCVDGNYDGATDAHPCPVGHGSTELKAIEDYFYERSLLEE